MKKNFTVNISGRLFQIDEDAYNMLQNYLDTIQSRMKFQQDGQARFDDLERRVSDLLNQQKLMNSDITTLEHVQNVMTDIGTPSEVCGESSSESASESANATAEGTAENASAFTGHFDESNAQTSNGERVEGAFTGEFNENQFGQQDNSNTQNGGQQFGFNREGFKNSYEQEFGNNGRQSGDFIFSNTRGKTFYRNPNDKFISGVMSGCARYFGGDVTLWRIGAIAFTLIFNLVGVLVYLFIALVIPYDPALMFPPQNGANNATDGTKTDNFSSTGDSANPTYEPAPKVDHGCAGGCLKAVFIILAIGAVITFVDSFTDIFNLHTLFPGASEITLPAPFAFLGGSFGVFVTAIKVITLCFIVGIPVYYYFEHKKAKEGKVAPMGRNEKMVLAIIWACMLYAFCFVPKITVTHSYNTTTSKFISPSTQDEYDKAFAERDSAMAEANRQMEKASAEMDSAYAEIDRQMNEANAELDASNAELDKKRDAVTKKLDQKLNEASKKIDEAGKRLDKKLNRINRRAQRHASND